MRLIDRPTDAQIARCPKAIRDYIINLERRDSAITRLNDEISNGGDNPHFGYTDVRRSFDEPAIMLPKYANLMAFPNERKRALRIDARDSEWHPFRLSVHALSTRLIVRPESGNAVTLEAEE